MFDGLFIECLKKKSNSTNSNYFCTKDEIKRAMNLFKKNWLQFEIYDAAMFTLYLKQTELL